MKKDIVDDLYDEGIYRYGSDELKRFEKQLTKYFSREYERHKNNKQSITIDQGPIALASKDLADSHYDEGLEFFKNFLDEVTMSYSMAYFNDTPEKVITSKKSLAQAQIDKFALITKRMKLKGDEKLLNIGCGFGYFESYLLKTFSDIQITSITHSKDQYDHILRRKKDLSDLASSDRFNIYLAQIDQQTVSDLGREKFDVACSIGMMEHVNNIELFFDVISKLLVKNGRMFHHLIVSRDLIPQLLDSDNTLIGSYFPGGKILSLATLKRDFKDFNLESSWFINGLNYWKTLDNWHANFWKNIDHLYPEKMDKERISYWNNYFVLCKAMFFPEDGQAYGNGQYLFYKRA